MQDPIGPQAQLRSADRRCSTSSRRPDPHSREAVPGPGAVLAELIPFHRSMCRWTRCPRTLRCASRSLPCRPLRRLRLRNPLPRFPSGSQFCCGEQPAPPPAADVAATDPEWFESFLADRGTRKTSAHTLKAYRQDFDAIASLIAGDGLRFPGCRWPTSPPSRCARRSPSTRKPMKRHRFGAAGRPGTCCAPSCTPQSSSRPTRWHWSASRSRTDAAQSTARRCGHRAAEHPGVRPEPRRASDWPERDRALILTALLAGLRADELLRANVSDIRRTDDGAVLTCTAKAARTAASRSNRSWSTSSSSIWTAGPSDSRRPPSGAPPPPVDESCRDTNVWACRWMSSGYVLAL